MITVKHISKSFADVQILKDISFVFETGKTNLIIGKSGSGKSVLTKCIVGLFEPDEGEIFYDERKLSDLKPKARKEIRKEIGMLFQASALFDSLTVEENVAFPLNMFTKMTKEEISDRVNFCLNRVNIINKNQLFPSELSGGMQKRVAIARAIVHNPINVLLDEPTNGLDVMSTRAMRDVIRNMKANGQCVIFSSHLMQEVVALCDEVFIIADGMIVESGSIDSLLNKYDSGFEDVFVQIIDQQTSEAP